MILHEHEDDGTESIGAGVLVNIEGRHFVATAAHCVRRNPRVIREEHWNANIRMPLRAAWIIKGGAHTDLDIAFLEISEAIGPEMREDQLFFNQGLVLQPDWSLHVIGYPVRTLETHDRLQMRTLRKKVFTSNLADQTDSAIKIYYPKIGYRLENDQWVETPFVPTPHGYSGGGCFIITERSADVSAFGHELLGIQSSWYPESRNVKVIPIRRWHAMVRTYLQPGTEG